MAKKIALSRGLFALVDVDDFARVSEHKWHVREWKNKKGFYAANNKLGTMHRFIMRAKKGQLVDHRNRNGLDNRRDNLRWGTQSLNCVNKDVAHGKYMRGTQPRHNRWRARIQIDGKERVLGSFDTEAQAHNSYLAALEKHYGEWVPNNLRRQK